MDELQKDLWELRKKYGLHLEDLQLKLEQMIMEHELSWQSGIEFFMFGDNIIFLD